MLEHWESDITAESVATLSRGTSLAKSGSSPLSVRPGALVSGDSDLQSGAPSGNKLESASWMHQRPGATFFEKLQVHCISSAAG